MRRLSFAALVLFLAVYGCKVTETESEMTARSEKHYPVHFVAEEIETRTVFGDAQASDGSTTYPTLWTENDHEIAVSLNLNGAKAAAVIPSEDFKSATFDADFSQSELEAPYVFYALSPFSAHVGAAPSHGGYHLNIPATQTPLESSCDEAAQVLVASEEAESIADFSSIEMHFSHVTAYGKLTLKNLSIPDGSTVRSIELTASVPFVGRFYYNYEEGSLEESSSSRTVTLLPDNLTMEEGIINEIWFACAPADLSGGTFKIDVNTSAGVLSRTLEIAEGKLAFKAGRISKFSVNMANAEFTPATDRWVLVTDASMLAAGDEIILASSATAGAAYALSTTQNTGNTPGRGVASVTIGDSNGTMILENPGATVEILTLLSGYYSDTFYLQETTSTTGRYLYSSTNYNTNSLNSAAEEIATNNTNRSYASWKITISDGTAVVSTYGSVKQNNSSSNSYYRQIRLNGTSFRTYRSSSQTSWNSSTTGTTAVYIYRKDVPVDVDNDPILEHDVYGAYLSGNNRVSGIGDQLSREYMNDGTLTFAILSPTTFEIAEFAGIPVGPAKGDIFTLNYNLISGRNQSDTDYNVTVVKVDGPKVWLSAGGGKGFIVKK